MVEISFYHLTKNSLEQALPVLLEKTLARGWKAVVLAGSAERAEALTQYLWTYRQDSFLPHGNAKDGDGKDQPIWLTHHDERPNEAEILFLVDGARSAKLSEYSRVCEIFPGHDEEAVAAARTRWREYQNVGYDLNYWQQGEAGWEKKS